jgi:flagellar assembly factor FliW
VKVATTRFGELEIEDTKVIAMPDGMLGFRGKRYILLDPGKGSPFTWLQSVDNPGLAFVVVDPLRFFPDYRVKLTADEYQKLLLNEGDEIVFLTVVTMAREPENITVNLQGPVAVNPESMTARQIVLEGNYLPRHPLFAPLEPPTSGRSQTGPASTPLVEVPSLICEAGLPSRS